MAAINPLFGEKLYELTALAYEQNIACPLLAQLNGWYIGQKGAMTAGLPIATGLPGETGFAAAVLAAIKSSPTGVDMNDLRAILAEHNQPAQTIGATIGRLIRAGQVEKRGDLWFFLSDTKKVESLGQRRRTGISAPAKRTASPANEERQTGTG